MRTIQGAMYPQIITKCPPNDETPACRPGSV